MADEAESSEPVLGQPRPAGRARQRYEGSIAQELVTRLGKVGFGDWIILFGASVLLSVLPMIILLSAMADTRIDDDISSHLGLSRQGARIVASLFHASTFRLNLGVFIGFLLAVGGTLAVARSVQVLYERAFELTAVRTWTNFARCAVWVAAITGLFILDANVSRPLRHDAGGIALLPVVDVVEYGLFFWWTIHFLLGGRRSWRDLAPAAVATAVFWVGLGFVSAFYFSSSLVSDSHLYGAIGVVFTLVTWFVAVGAVITLGAVVGAMWRGHRTQAAATTDH